MPVHLLGVAVSEGAQGLRALLSLQRPPLLADTPLLEAPISLGSQSSPPEEREGRGHLRAQLRGCWSPKVSWER